MALGAARRDISALFDPGTTESLGTAIARGKIDGQNAFAYCVNGAVVDTSLGKQVVTAIDTAVRDGSPVIGVWLHDQSECVDGVESMDGIGRMFAAMTRASGWIPQISVVLGHTAGAVAYGPALTDLVVSSDIDVADILVGSEDEALFRARQVTAMMGQQGHFVRFPPNGPPEPPSNPLHAVLDGELLELRAETGRNIVIGLGRLGSRTVGVVANKGALDAPGSDKAARFVRMCDAFGIPLVVIADAAGPEREVRGGAKLLHAFAASVVPRITLVTGPFHVAMNSRSLGATRVFAWPGAKAADGVDEVIDPAHTRRKLVEAFLAAPERRGHHGNFPL